LTGNTELEDADLRREIVDLAERVKRLEAGQAVNDDRWRSVLTFLELTGGAAAAVIRRLRDTR
jgi:hypothetical protein